MRLPVALVLVIALADVAAAQSAVGEAPEYPTATAALNALRGKSGVNISMQSGWTVIEDKSTLSLWSFTPPGHAAYLSAIHRKVVQEGNNIFLKMDVLCAATKPVCEALVADFEKLNGKVRDDLKR
jgi:hypothetical protein